MKKWLVALAATLALMIPAQAKAFGVFGLVNNPSGVTCGSNCRWFVRDFTQGTLLSWPATPYNVSAGAVRSYPNGGALLWLTFGWNALGYGYYYNHNYEAYARFTCPNGIQYRYSEHHSFAPGGDGHDWWMGTYSSWSTCLYSATTDGAVDTTVAGAAYAPKLRGAAPAKDSGRTLLLKCATGDQRACTKLDKLNP
jgi:hypothetical protein